MARAYKGNWSKILPVLEKLQFHSLPYPEDRIFDWWEQSHETLDLLPGLGWQCWIFHYRGIIWFNAHWDQTDAFVDRVKQELMRQQLIKELPHEDRRGRLLPRNQVVMFGPERYQQFFEEVEAKEQAAQRDQTAGDSSATEQ